MPDDEKDGIGKTADAGPIVNKTDDNEAFGEALSTTGFAPAKVGRKIVSQGRRGETLRKPRAKNSN